MLLKRNKDTGKYKATFALLYAHESSATAYSLLRALTAAASRTLLHALLNHSESQSLTLDKHMHSDDDSLSVTEVLSRTKLSQSSEALISLSCRIGFEFMVARHN